MQQPNTHTRTYTRNKCILQMNISIVHSKVLNSRKKPNPKQKHTNCAMTALSRERTLCLCMLNEPFLISTEEYPHSPCYEYKLRVKARTMYIFTKFACNSTAPFFRSRTLSLD